MHVGRFRRNDQRLPTDYPNVYTSGTFGCVRVIDLAMHVAINIAGDNAEMALMQAAHHLSHNLASIVHGFGALERRAKFIVNRGPVHAAEERVPMRIADCSPDIFERIEIELPLGGSERLARCGDRKAEKCETRAPQTLIVRGR